MIVNPAAPDDFAEYLDSWRARNNFFGMFDPIVLGPDVLPHQPGEDGHVPADLVDVVPLSVSINGEIRIFIAPGGNDWYRIEVGPANLSHMRHHSL